MISLPMNIGQQLISEVATKVFPRWSYRYNIQSFIGFTYQIIILQNSGRATSLVHMAFQRAQRIPPPHVSPHALSGKFSDTSCIFYTASQCCYTVSTPTEKLFQWNNENFNTIMKLNEFYKFKFCQIDFARKIYRMSKIMDT